MKVLLVAGDEACRAQMMACGCMVRVVSDPSQVDALLSADYDAVVFDVRSVRSDGAELVSHVRSNFALMAVLIVGFEAEDVALWLGADAWFDRSTNEDSLRELIARVVRLRGSRSRQASPENGWVLIWGGDVRRGTLLNQALTNGGHRVVSASGKTEFLRNLRNHNVCLALCPTPHARSPRDLVQSTLLYDPRIRVLLISEAPNLEDAVHFLSEGAQDILVEPLGSEQVLGAVGQAWGAYAQSTPEGRPKLRRLQILVVEPFPGRHSIITRLIDAQSGAKVITSPTVENARTALRSGHYDALVYDHSLSSASAATDLQLLARVAPDCPVIVVTESDDAGFQEQLVMCGVEDVVESRRLGAEGLMSRIRRAVDRQKRELKRRRVARDLQRREASQRELISRSLDAMLVVNLDDIVVFANPAAEALFDKHRLELFGHRNPLIDRTSDNGELTIKSTRGEHRVDCVEVGVTWDGNSCHLITLRDVTERRRAEQLREQLIRTDRLAGIGQLAAGVAHEINNPAAYVLANLTAATAQVQDAATALKDVSSRAVEQLLELEEVLAESVDGMRRIQGISRDLCNFSRIESQHVVDFNVNDSIESAVRLTDNVVRHKAQTVLDLRDGLTVSGSPAKFTQVLINLLINAAQAIPEGGPLKNQIVITTAREDEWIVVRVEDSGPGIASEHQERIFDPFYTTKPAQEGTGLGLTMCAEIIRLHNGSIGVGPSDKYSGASFTIKIPGVRRSGRQLTPVVPSSSTSLEAHVLLIDDEPMILRSFKRMLSHCRVTTASGGEQGLQVLRKGEEFDIIVCDLMMPGMNGSEFFSVVAQEMPGLINRVVFCSGGAVTPGVREFMERSGCLFLEKPLTIDRFNDALELVKSAPRLRLVSSS